MSYNEIKVIRNIIMKIKINLILCFVFVWCLQGNAQNLCIAPAHIKSDTKLPDNVDTQIHSKLLMALTSSGISAESGAARYIMVPQFSVNSSRTTAGIPPRVVVNFDLAFNLVDLENGKVFSTYVFPFESSGANLANAMAKGVSGLSLDNHEFSNFLQTSKNKVITYYEQELPKFLSKAKALVQSNNYEDALSVLAEIPEDIKGYDKVLSIMTSTYKSYADHMAAELLQKANAVWAASPNETGAQNAVEFISQMPIGSKYAGDASKLLRSINNKMRINDSRLWEAAQRAAKNEHLERMAIIKAVKDVSIERAKNSRPLIAKYNIW